MKYWITINLRTTRGYHHPLSVDKKTRFCIAMKLFDKCLNGIIKVLFEVTA